MYIYTRFVSVVCVCVCIQSESAVVVGSRRWYYCGLIAKLVKTRLRYNDWFDLSGRGGGCGSVSWGGSVASLPLWKKKEVHNDISGHHLLICLLGELGNDSPPLSVSFWSYSLELVYIFLNSHPSFSKCVMNYGWSHRDGEREREKREKKGQSGEGGGQVLLFASSSSKFSFFQSWGLPEFFNKKV